MGEFIACRLHFRRRLIRVLVAMGFVSRTMADFEVVGLGTGVGVFFVVLCHLQITDSIPDRYPGAQCDIESYVYMPLLEELKYMPTEKYARAKELLSHSQMIGERYGLYDKTLFQTEVHALRWTRRLHSGASKPVVTTKSKRSSSCQQLDPCIVQSYLVSRALKITRDIAFILADGTTTILVALSTRTSLLG